MPTKSPEPAKHDAPTRIQAQPFSSHDDFRARNFDRLRVSQPSWRIQTRQIHPLVVHSLPAHRRRHRLGHVPLFTLIIGCLHDRQSSDTLDLHEDVLHVHLAGNCQIEEPPSADRESCPQKHSAATDLANATPQHRQIDRIFQRMLLSLHTPR